MKNFFAVIFFFLSICFLIPGVTQPLMTIKATIDKQQIFDMVTASFLEQSKGNIFIENIINLVVQKFKFEGTIEVFESTRSLVETMDQLISNDHVIVGLLIGIFGVVIPGIKIFLTLISLISNSRHVRRRLLLASSLLGKWSMSDVFVIAIFVAFLAINANEQSINTIQMNAELGQGFYYFATYCLLAIAAGQLFQYQEPQIEK
jgi:hypothetical protein